MFKIGEVVFAKVKGWCPWPGKIMCRVARNQFKIFFYGTSQESLVKSDCIWSCKENLDEFSKKYGTKKDYFQALEEMKKTPDVFKVSSSDLCAHECLTCDPRRRIEEPTRGKKGFQMSKSNVKVGAKKTKDNVQDFKAKDEVVSKNKAFKKIVKSKQRIKKARRSHRDNAFKKLLGKKFHLSQMVNDQVAAKKKSFKKILNSKQTMDKVAHHENVLKESLGKESDEVAVEDKAELGIQQKNAVKIKKREGRWFFSNETKNKEKNLKVETESNKSRATEAQLGKGGAKMSESLMELSLPKEIKDLPKATICEENLKNQQVKENCESEAVPVISLKPGSIEVVTIASNNNESEEILDALMDVDGGKGKLKNYDVEMSAVDESKTLQKFKYTFKEVDMSNASFPYGGITGTVSNMQSQPIMSKGVDHIESTENPKGVDHTESTENPKGVDHIESTENTKAVVHIESTENTKECSEMTQKIKEPVEKINLEDSITEVWLKEDENEREAKTMMDIDNIIYGEDVLDLDVSYTMLDLSQENGELSEVIQAGSTGDTLKELMDVEAVTEMPDMGSPLNFEFFTWGND